MSGSPSLRPEIEFDQAWGTAQTLHCDEQWRLPILSIGQREAHLCICNGDVSGIEELDTEGHNAPLLAASVGNF